MMRIVLREMKPTHLRVKAFYPLMKPIYYRLKSFHPELKAFCFKIKVVCLRVNPQRQGTNLI